MKLVRVAAIAALIACGGKSKPAQLAPLPDDTKPAAEPDGAKPPAGDGEGVADGAPPAGPPPPSAPAGPLEVKIAPQQTAVTVLAKGTGKAARLRYGGKAGAVQQVELALDFSSTESMNGQSNELIMPTIVLAGEAATKTVDKDGKADYAITVRTTDARDVANSRIKTADLKQMLGSLGTLVIGGSVDATGAAGGDVTMRVEKPDPLTAGALEMVRLTFPTLPVLPKEPLGVGGKWQTTTVTKLADKIVVTQVTEYEVVAATAAAWTVKGKTKVTGADQDLDGGKIGNIRGAGTTELTLPAGALYPTYKTTLETSFTASEGDQKLTLALRLGGTVTAK